MVKIHNHFLWHPKDRVRRGCSARQGLVARLGYGESGWTCIWCFVVAELNNADGNITLRKLNQVNLSVTFLGKLNKVEGAVTLWKLNQVK